MAKKPKAKPKKPVMTQDRANTLRNNPGTRSLLADKFLTPDQLQQRQLNQRLNAPVTEGSSLTNRDLAHQRQAATTLQFGPAESAIKTQIGQAQQNETDTAGWYQAYLADLAKHQQNIANNNTAANTAFTALTGNVGQLGTGVEGTQEQGTAANALAVRQALVGSFAGAQNMVGNAANNYADTLTNVVGPGEKLTAQTQNRRYTDRVKGKLTDLAAQKGAFGSKFNADTIAGEQKNVLAQQVLTNKTAAQQAQEKLAAANIDIKRGIDPVTGKPLPKKPTKGPDMGKVNAYGYTESDWRKMSTAERQKVIAAAKAKGKNGTGGTKGPEWLTPNEMNTGITQLAKLKDFANKAKTGQPFVPGHTPQGPMTRQQAAQKIFGAAPSLKDPSLLAAALDAAYDGHLSPSTVQRLIDAGYKPSRVAQTLGVKTAGQMPKAPKVQIHTRSPSSGPSGGDPTGRFRS